MAGTIPLASSTCPVRLGAMPKPSGHPGAPPTAPGPLSRVAPLQRTGGANHPPRCRACGYVLQGLDGVHACPECAAHFDLADPSTYTRIAPFNAFRFWLPGFGLAAAFVLLSIPVMAYGLGAWGWSLFLALPASAGAIASYRFRVSRFILPMMGILLALTFIGGIASAGLGGVFCALILLGIVLVPIFTGIGAGAILRSALKSGGYDQSGYLPLLLIAAIPYLCIPIEKWTTPRPAPETVSTSTIINASADECWDGLVFYEEVTHPPPWILRVGLARPLATRGPSHNPGDRRVCVYNKGTISKQIRRAEPGRLLSFEVIEQNIGYERDLRLLSGSFVFEPLDVGLTRVTLTSTYEPRLTPRFCWRWGEQLAFRTLHTYVLEGIARNTQHQRPANPDKPTVAARDAP